MRAYKLYSCTCRLNALNCRCAWAWDWTGDHRVMEEASTDILVDEDIYFSLSIMTLVSLNVVWKFVMFCNSENYTITLPISLILVLGSWHLCVSACGTMQYTNLTRSATSLSATGHAHTQSNNTQHKGKYKHTCTKLYTDYQCWACSGSTKYVLTCVCIKFICYRSCTCTVYTCVQHFP